MTVHETLKRLRLQSGMTQQQAAEQLHLTRQAISGYESGRTQPDVEMLARLAALYGTDLEGILYGQDGRLKELRRVERPAKGLLLLLPALSLFFSAFYRAANHFFRLEEGQLTPEEKLIWESRLRLVRAGELTEGLLLAAATLGLLLLLILLLAARHRLPWRRKLGYVLALSLAVLVPPLLLALTDPVYGIMNYLFTPLLVVARVFLFLAAELLLGCVLHRKS